MDYSSLYRHHSSPHHPPRAAQAHPPHAPSYGNIHLADSSTQGSPTSSCHDVVFLVGKRRQAYHVTAESLIRGSEYFRRLLQQGNQRAAGAVDHGGLPSPLVMECEEGIFESLLLLMRYGTLDAVPPMSAAQAYQLKREADFYGISYAEHGRLQSSSTDNGSDVSSSCSGSPKSSNMNISPPPTPRCARQAGRQIHEGIPVSCNTPPQGLAELAEFPLDLADPARLVLISCLDREQAKFYSCDCSGSGSAASTQWALSFHHRHAFCTACGACAPPTMPAKHFADMFMAAAAHYSSQHGGAGAGLSAKKWRVSSDSTCLLRFVSSAGDGQDTCGCARAERGAAPLATIWAANSFFSHAFCTRCGDGAKGPVLLSVLLALRYRGGKKGSSSGRSTFGP